MSDTNDNSKLDHRELTDTELDAVSGAFNAVEHGAATGGTKANGSGSWAEALAIALGRAMNSQLLK